MILTLAKEKQAFLSNTKGARHTVSVLAYPKPRKRFFVDTEPSNVWIGGVLLQVEDGEDYSKTLNKAKEVTV
jgi:hypothetical protein